MEIKILGPGCHRCHELDKRTREVAKELGLDSSVEYIQDLNKILVDEAPYIYMYNKLEARAFAPYVQGFVTRSDQANNFWTVWLDQ